MDAGIEINHIYARSWRHPGMWRHVSCARKQNNNIHCTFVLSCQLAAAWTLLLARGGSSIHTDRRANSGSHSPRGWDQLGRDTAGGPSRAVFVRVMPAHTYGSAVSDVLLPSYCKFKGKGNSIPGQALRAVGA